ncbi:MAG: hypothetical protein ABIG39_07830 [Candidatus Micrarchaeota archaeon]
MNDTGEENIKLDGCFRRTCEIVLREDVGGLHEFEGFLRRYTVPLQRTISDISGKDIHYSKEYTKNARFLSLDEIGKMNVEPLNPNDIKDIDGLLNAAAERFYYAGNKITGNSRGVIESDGCVDVVNVLQSHQIYNCENVAYCQMLITGKFMFGCSWSEENNFCINLIETYRASRCFESSYIANSRDMYFSYNCKDCNDMMFCFNLRSKKACIGNNPLPKDRYIELKEKLLGEIAEMMRKKKRVPPLMALSTEAW